MARKEILKSPAYWIAVIQVALYNCAEKFMGNNGLNRTQLAKHLNVSKGYVSQLLNGEFDHKLSTFVELSLSFGYIPKIEFVPIEKFSENEEKPVQFGIESYEGQTGCKCITLNSNNYYSTVEKIKERAAV